MKLIFPRLNAYLLMALLCSLLACQSEPNVAISNPEKKQAIHSLPLEELEIEDLSNFQPTDKNWQVVGHVIADYEDPNSFEVTKGTGVLVNNQTESDHGHLATNFEHGDMLLDLEFMVPKGSNSGIYFQGRYEIQIFDSYGIEPAASGGCGGIYQRWDASRPEGDQGYEGHAPKVNASKAPGLWQHFKILFRAPKFDDQGLKIKNAKFDYVYHNGFLIHENVELTGPTRAAKYGNNEKLMGPLIIQGDHGKVAFRNIAYQSYGQDSLTLQDLSYTLYDYPIADEIPKRFDTLKVIGEGVYDWLEVENLSDQKKRYAIIYEGKLNVPISGEFLFESGIDDGGDIFIDQQLVVHNEGNPGFDKAYGKVNLTAGIHDFKFTYYNKDWMGRALIYYQGPGIYKRTLATKINRRPWEKEAKNISYSAKDDTPEILRSFVQHEGIKRTHCISVGEPTGLHYSYDLTNGSLLKMWRGDFADVTEMWHSRGEPQLLHPLNASIELNSEVSVAQLKSKNSNWPIQVPNDIEYKGYELDKNGRPKFQYHLNRATVTDSFFPGNHGRSLNRCISVERNGEKKLYIKIAQADQIQKLPTGQFSIGGSYYLNFDDPKNRSIIRQNGGRAELLIPVKNDMEVNYKMMW